MERILSSLKKLQYHQCKKQVQLLLVILWVLFLSLDIFTDNLESLLTLKSVNFIWISSPNLLSFFNFHDLTRIHPFWFLVKPGHFVGFAIMNLLLYNLTRNYKIAITATVMFAISSEILQLFFGRDGRLYDVIIDSLGAVSDYYLLKKFNRLK